MMDLTQAHFLRPWWLLLVLLALLLMWWRRPDAAGRSAWQRAIDPHLLPHVLSGQARGQASRLNHAYLPAFVFLIALALAGPTLKRLPEQSSLIKKPLVIVLELSPHMLASDISPSRLKRAIYKLGDFLHQQKGREVALIAFAGDAHVVVPPTEDHQTILTLCESLSPELMPIAGANLRSGLELSQSMAGSNIVVISSSNFSDSPQVQDWLKQHQQPLTFWWFATNTGAPMLSNDGRFLKQQDGSISMSVLQSDIMAQMAASSKVRSQLFTADNQDILAISRHLDDTVASNTNAGKISYDNWYDLGPYLLAIAMALFWWAVFAHGASWWMLALVLIAPVPRAQAGPLATWFTRPEQQAYEALRRDDPNRAAELYPDHFGKGTALFKAKKYDEAIEHLQHVKSSDGCYNLGNAYAQQGKIQEAIKAYSEALSMDAKNSDAQTNKELLEKLLKDKEQQTPQEPEPEKNQQKDADQPGEQQQTPQEPEPKKNQQENGSQPHGEEQQPKNSGGPAGEQNVPPPPKDSVQNKEKPNPAGLEEQRHQLDKNTHYYLDQLERNSNLYLKRKFLYESRQRQGG